MRIALIAVAAICLALVGCGGSDSAIDRIVAQMTTDEFTDWSCIEARPEEVAGEREMTYTCAYKQAAGRSRDGAVIAHTRELACMAVVDDHIYVIRAEAC